LRGHPSGAAGDALGQVLAEHSLIIFGDQRTF
jgi:hypothetical protein